MSGQPVQKHEDVNKYHNEYMETLGLQQSINDMNLQANKNYLLTGTLPAVSQMKDNRTTSEILADTEKLKAKIASAIATISNMQFGYGVVNGLINSPLNVDNKLIIFMAQKGDEFILKLKKEYGVGVKGDINDIDTMVKYIEDFFNKTYGTIQTIKGYMNNNLYVGGPQSSKLLSGDNIKTLIEDINNIIVEIYNSLHKIKKTYTNPVKKSINKLTNMMNDLKQISKILLTTNELKILKNKVLDEVEGNKDFNRSYDPERSMDDITNEEQINKYAEYLKIIDTIPKPSIHSIYTILRMLEEKIKNKDNNYSELVLSLENLLKPLFTNQSIDELNFNIINEIIRSRPIQQPIQQPIQEESDSDEDDKINQEQAEYKKQLERERQSPYQKTISEQVVDDWKDWYDAKPIKESYKESSYMGESPYQKSIPEHIMDYADPFADAYDNWVESGLKKNPAIPSKFIPSVKGEYPYQKTISEQIVDDWGSQPNKQYGPLSEKDSTSHLQGLFDFGSHVYNNWLTNNEHNGENVGEYMWGYETPNGEHVKGIDETDPVKYAELWSKYIKDPISNKLQNIQKQRTELSEKKELDKHREEMERQKKIIENVETSKKYKDIQKKQKDLSEKKELKKQNKESTESTEIPSTDYNIVKKITDYVNKLESIPDNELSSKLSNTKLHIVNKLITDFKKSGLYNDTYDIYNIENTSTNAYAINMLKLILHNVNRRFAGYGLKKKRSNFRGFGIAEINHKKLDMGILSIRRPSKGNYKSVPQQRITPILQNIIKDINGGKVPNFNDINSLTSDEKEYLHKVVCASGFDEKFSIPTPNKDAMEKEIHQFEVLKGEIMSGNDSKALIKKFKILILKLANKGSLGKKEANDVLYTLLSLGY